MLIERGVHMKNFYLKASLPFVLLAAIGATSQAVKADQVVVVFSAPVVVSTTTTTTANDRMVAGPGLLVTNSLNQQLMVPSQSCFNQVGYVTTGATITGFTCCSPDDLLTRRDDLIARIISEKNNGKLSSSQADGLISEVQSAYSAKASLPAGDESDVDHVKGIKRIYRSFDRISNDIVKDSRQGNKELAGKYTYIVL
jgi:hypothetical protein